MRDLLTWATHTAKSSRVSQRATFYGAAPLGCAWRNRPTRTGGVRFVLAHDFDAVQLERADDPLPEHEFHNLRHYIQLDPKGEPTARTRATLSASIENTRLFDEVRARNSELRVALEQQMAISVISRSPSSVDLVLSTISETARVPYPAPRPPSSRKLS